MTLGTAHPPEKRAHRHAFARAMRGRVALALATSLAAVLAVPAATAMAVPPPLPQLKISSPAPGSWTTSPQPLFLGTGYSEPWVESEPVTLKLYSGPAAVGTPTTMLVPGFFGPTWQLTPILPLAAGTYTAVAEQPYNATTLVSDPVTFFIDTTPPNLTLQVPASESAGRGASQLVAGTAGTAEGDLQEVTIKLFAGRGTDPGTFMQSLLVGVSEGSWSGTLGGLTPGTYTVVAEQSDRAANSTQTAPVSFTLEAPALPAAHPPPTASFTWFPATPSTGQTVTLVSSSTDAASPLTGFAWAPAGGAFRPGGPVVVTSFTTPGDHVMQLRVTAADGLASIASQTIHVTRPALTPMQPFPIVRIAGLQTGSGVNLNSLTAQAPRGARVTVSCRGRGCPVKSETRMANSSRRRAKSSTVEVAFRRFERSLRAGVVLEIRVSKPGRIGKYTRFSIRRGRLPVRTDACLASTEPTPIRCPS
jgi:hypothetical protein